MGKEAFTIRAVRDVLAGRKIDVTASCIRIRPKLGSRGHSFFIRMDAHVVEILAENSGEKRIVLSRG